MTGQLSLLLQARSETEFFIILYNLLHKDYNTGFYPNLTRGANPDHGYAMQLEIEQVLETPGRLPGSTAFRKVKTHKITLYQDGALTWDILEQQTVSGLKDIQAMLSQMGDPFAGVNSLIG